MKYLFALFLTSILVAPPLQPNLLAQIDSLADVLPMKDGDVYYSEIFQIENATKAELFHRAKRWVVDNYRSANDVVQLSDEANGELIAKGNYSTVWKSTFMTADEVRINHTIRIFVKDGRYKFELLDFRVSGYSAPTQYTRGGPWEYTLPAFLKMRPVNVKKFIQETVAPRNIAVLESLKKSMIAKKSSDW